MTWTLRYRPLETMGHWSSLRPLMIHHHAISLLNISFLESKFAFPVWRHMYCQYRILKVLSARVSCAITPAPPPPVHKKLVPPWEIYGLG